MTPNAILIALHLLRQPVCCHRTIARWSLGATLWVCMTACGIDKLGITPALPSEQVLLRVRFEAPIYNLATAAPYDTVQLRATGYSGTGQVIDAPIEFSVATVADTKLSIDSIGMLHALADGKKLVIRASMRYNGTTRTDSAFVYVIAGTPAQHGAQMRFSIAAQDSAKVASGRPADTLVALLRQDSAGNNMQPLVVKVWSADNSILAIRSNYDILGDNVKSDYVRISGRRPGWTTLYASAYAYGVFIQDSITLRVGWPLLQSIAVAKTFLPGTTTQVIDFSIKKFIVGVGACVVWRNDLNDEVDVTFDDPSTVGPPSQSLVGCTIRGTDPDLNGGNIAPFKVMYRENGGLIPGSNMRSRTFPKPGVYTYRSTLWGTTGTIVVCDEKNDSTCAPENYEWFTPTP